MINMFPICFKFKNVKSYDSKVFMKTGIEGLIVCRHNHQNRVIHQFSQLYMLENVKNQFINETHMNLRSHSTSNFTNNFKDMNNCEAWERYEEIQDCQQYSSCPSFLFYSVSDIDLAYALSAILGGGASLIPKKSYASYEILPFYTLKSVQPT